MADVDIGKKIIEIMKSEDFRKLDPQGAEKTIAMSILTNVRTFYTMYCMGKNEDAFKSLDALYEKNSSHRSWINTWLQKTMGGTREYQEYITYKTRQMLNRK